MAQTKCVRWSIFPFPAGFLDVIHTHLQPLKCYEIKRRTDTEDLMRRSREGV